MCLNKNAQYCIVNIDRKQSHGTMLGLLSNIIWVTLQYTLDKLVCAPSIFLNCAAHNKSQRRGELSACGPVCHAVLTCTEAVFKRLKMETMYG